jgi:hypothetical protein
MGLLIVEPNAIERMPDGGIAYTGSVTWQEIARDNEKFINFLGSVIKMLEQLEPPEPDENCEWCKYRAASRLNKF